MMTGDEKGGWLMMKIDDDDDDDMSDEGNLMHDVMASTTTGTASS